MSPNTGWGSDIEKANALLDAGGWRRGADGIRVKQGKWLRMLFQTPNQSIRQKIQAIVKQAYMRAGIECELKAVSASVYLSSDPGNVETEAHFYADLQLSLKIFATTGSTRLQVLLRAPRAPTAFAAARRAR